MDSSAAVTSDQIILAQSKAIDSILARLIVLDPQFSPVRALDWPKIQEGRMIADRLERETVDGLTQQSGVGEADLRADCHGAVGDSHP